MPDGMKVTLLLFARAAQLSGTERTELDLGRPCTIEQLRDRLLSDFPALGPLVDSLLFAIDEEMAQPTDLVHPGQTVAVMPPFSGG